MSSQKQRILEHEEADLERSSYIEEANGPTTRKRGRLTMEDEMLIKRQEHEIHNEKEK